MNVNPSTLNSSNVIPSGANITKTQATQALVKGPVPTSEGGPEQTSSNQPGEAATKAAIQKLNERLAHANMQVEFDLSAPINQLWLNVVDKASGSVIQKIPPDGVRKLVENPDSGGFLVDHPI